MESKHIWQFNEVTTLDDLREILSIVDQWEGNSAVSIYAGGLNITSAPE